MVDVTWKGIPDMYVAFRFGTKLTILGATRVREKFSYPLVPRTSTLLNLVVQSPRVLVQNVLSCS